MTLKVYADRNSHVTTFPRNYHFIVNGIGIEEVKIDLSKRQHLTPEFHEIYSMKKLPAIVDGRLKLLRGILLTFSKEQKFTLLDWHHSNLRPGAATYVLNSTLAPSLVMPLNPVAAAEGEKVLSASLKKIESFRLKGRGRFLHGSSQPSIADLNLVCEIMQLESKKMMLKVYADRLSQPSRAVIILCKVNEIDFEEVKIDLSKGQHLTPEFEEINPMKKVPVIMDGTIKIFESHAIMIYLACVFPGVADHWYPPDMSQRANIHSVLDWHHSNLRRGAAKYVFNSVLAPALGMPLNQVAAAEDEKVLSDALKKIESFWLNGTGRFLHGSSQPSIADLSLVCEIMQLELVDNKDRERILGPHERVMKWIDDTKNATLPHFDEVHSILYKVKEKLKTLQSEKGVGETVTNKELDDGLEADEGSEQEKCSIGINIVSSAIKEPDEVVAGLDGGLESRVVMDQIDESG